jgi:uncharacterized protein (DUF58 family)
VIFFSGKIEKFIPPKKGKSNILRIIRELIDFKPEDRGTNITEAIRYLTNAIKKRCTAFVISDFMDDNKDLEMALSIANNKHDVVALKIYDEREKELPSIGMIKLKDAENGNYVWVDSSSSRIRKIYSDWWQKQSARHDLMFKKSGVDYTSIDTKEDYVKSLMALFKKRAVKQ